MLFTISQSSNTSRYNLLTKVVNAYGKESNTAMADKIKKEQQMRKSKLEVGEMLHLCITMVSYSPVEK
ncbi:hypothetical protein Y032_0083g1690 [Ancylostoma ceylanicum]|uniref:Uncharacterized protein n=1 Tax=Ancylostoma ceylanicum TaxID=53326 RepID=A0A016TRD3_9BILA|nr:hypothetical protein Y032_0083g1690 [Ancylostoma ceylanicum]